MTSTITDLTALADRLRGLSGPDRELDIRLWMALALERDVVSFDDIGSVVRASYGERASEVIGWIDPGEHSRNFTAIAWLEKAAPALTGSVDAALALCERLLPGHKRTMTERAADCRVVIWTPFGACAGAADGPTLCAAILLAVIDALITALQGRTE